MVTLKFFATLRDLTGKKELIVDGKTVEEAIAEAGNLLNLDLMDELFENEKPKKGVIVLVNGRNIEHLNGLSTILEDGDILSLFPPVGGG